MTRIAALFLALTLAALAVSAQAAIQQVRVLAVGIDNSSGKARATALDYAQKRAVYLVARKLPVENVGAKVAAFTPEQFRGIVRGAEITQERRDGQTTYAEVTVSVVDTVLKRELGLPEGTVGDADAPTKMRGVLVLPVYVKDKRPYLWEKENALREPLRAEVLRQAHGAVLVPAGDLDDLRLVDYNNALSVTGQELQPMFIRYGAEEIIVAIFTDAGTGEQAEPSILLRRLTPKDARIEKLAFEPGEGTSASGAQVKDAAVLIAGAVTQIASSTAASDQERLEKATKIPVKFNYANPRELAQMQEALRSGPGVLMLALPAISTGAISGTVYLEGDPQKLRETLAKTGMIVTDAGDGWQLSLR